MKMGRELMVGDVSRHDKPEHLSQFSRRSDRCSAGSTPMLQHSIMDCQGIGGVVERRLEGHLQTLEERAANGCIVDGHGDLRPENICLTDPPAIFDCIEFSADLRRGDVLSDVAFLTASLDLAGRSDLTGFLSL